MPSSECPLCLCSVEDPVVTPCCHIMCRSCLKDIVSYSADQAEVRTASPTTCSMRYAYILYTCIRVK